MSTEFGHRFWDGTVGRDESREAAYGQAARFKPGAVEVVLRPGPDSPWKRDLVQPHTLEERFAALFEARREAEELSTWRAQKLTDLGLSPNPWSGGEPEHALLFQEKQIKALRRQVEALKSASRES